MLVATALTGAAERDSGRRVVDHTDEHPPDKLVQAGSIAFQTYGAEGHAGWVKFRAIRVKPLNE